MSEASLPDLPKANYKDRAYDTAKILLNSVSKLATTVLPLELSLGDAMAMLIRQPLQKRLEVWLTALAEKVIEVAEKVEGISVEHIVESEIFIDAVLHAEVIAVKTRKTNCRRCLMRWSTPY